MTSSPNSKRQLQGGDASATLAGMIESSALRMIMTNAPTATLDAYAPLLSVAMREASISTVTRGAAFIAQLAHESAEFRYMEEVADGNAYEGRQDLGNVRPGDGRRFKGRGPIQVTGRSNYRAAGQALALDLEDHPEMASLPSVGFRIAAWYWTVRGLNRLADACDFRSITKAINGGYNGLADRIVYYHKALEVLGRSSEIEV